MNVRILVSTHTTEHVQRTTTSVLLQINLYLKMEMQTDCVGPSVCHQLLVQRYRLEKLIECSKLQMARVTCKMTVSTTWKCFKEAQQ